MPPVAARHALFQHDVRAAARGRVLLIPLGQHGQGRGGIIAYDHAFTGRESVGFHDDAAGELIERFARLTQRVHDGEARRRDLVPFHEPLGKNLTRLKPRAGSVRTKHQQTGVAQTVGHAGCERVLGTHDDEIDRVRLRTIEDRPRIGRGNFREIRAARRRPSIPRRVKERLTRRRLRQLPRKRIFPRATTNN
jgi:hypothetical protein